MITQEATTNIDGNSLCIQRLCDVAGDIEISSLIHVVQAHDNILFVIIIIIEAVVVIEMLQIVV